ncbi:MAG: VCBS repeat-containing protein [Bryobacterales bacterium]|nr:VCBS repeat-containing protein [Bryobacterales bacterium]
MRMRVLSFFLLAAMASAQSPPRWRHLSSAAGELPAPGPSDQQTAALACDIDSDGDADFFIGARVVGPAVTFFRRGTDGWEKLVVEPEFLRIEAGGACHDIDGDGDRDIVFGADAGDTHIWWWENPLPDFDPAKPWTRHVIKSSGANKHHDQIFGDFDGDGAIELVSWNQRAHALLLFEIPAEPRTAPEWTGQTIYEWTGEEHEGVAAADVNGDGVTDLVGGGRWFEHVGGGQFEAHVIDDAFRFSRAAAGQLVEGGRPEVVFAPGDVDGPIRWYEFVDGKWVGHDLPNNQLIHGHSIGLDDVNGDGHPDILSAEMGQWGKRPEQHNDNARLRVYYGDGKGSFVEQVIARGEGNHETRLADLDGDGDLDILAKPYNWRTPRIDVWINEGP